MVTSQFVQDVVLLSEGKLASFASGSTKWNRIVAQGNFFLQQFVRERGVDWYRYYIPDQLLATVTATDTFALTSNIQKLSQQEGDPVRITHTNGNHTDYTLITPDRLREYDTGNYCAVAGRNLIFNKPFVSTDRQFGGSITVPAFLFPTAFSADNDVLDIDNPGWLVYTVAADRVKNDVTRKDLRADLVAQANEALMGMREDNEAQIMTPTRSWNPVSHTEDWWY